MSRRAALPGGASARLLAVVASVLLVALTVGACSSSGGSGPSSAQDLATRLARAKSALDSAGSITIKLKTDQLPSGVTGLLEADGTGTHAPAFKGSVTVSPGAGSVSADVVAVNGKDYAKLGFSPVWAPLDPSQYGAPDPALLFKPGAGVSAFLTHTTHLVAGGQVRSGQDVLTQVKGTLPGSAVASVIPSADKAKSFSVTYQLSDGDQVRQAVITGPFYAGHSDVTYTLTLETSSTDVSITAP
ncbi:MAG: LppX_LprAFG lipoprotein [Nocardioidaceae bacterium]